MVFRPGVGINFGPVTHVNQLPFIPILEGFIERGFAPLACRDHLTKIAENRSLSSEIINPDGCLNGGMLVTDKFLYARPEEYLLSLDWNSGKENHSFSLPESKAPTFAELIRWSVVSRDISLALKRFGFLPSSALEKTLNFSPESYPSWPVKNKSGIYRREHASLLVRSETTSILIDPISLQAALLPELPKKNSEKVDAILITHSHSDHWHLPSILYQVGDDRTIPVIVPNVPLVNLLTPVDMKSVLVAADQNSMAPQWGETIKIGDIEIDILPFYGEQPTRLPPGPDSRLRSWGNCYRINTPEFSVLILVDSGADPAGDMREAISESVRRRGPADVVASCLREFASPFFGGLSHYFVTLPFQRMAELYENYKKNNLPTTTAGPSGVVDLIQTAGAHYFLPYANGYNGFGLPISDIGWGQGEESEATALLTIDKLRKNKSAEFEIVPWKTGDFAVITNKSFKELI
jgi:hypothetical protein